MTAAILAAILPVIKWAIDLWTKKNSAEIVKRAEAQGVQHNTDEIRVLIHAAHFAATPEQRQFALNELRRRGATT